MASNLRSNKNDLREQEEKLGAIRKVPKNLQDFNAPGLKEASKTRVPQGGALQDLLDNVVDELDKLVTSDEDQSFSEARDTSFKTEEEDEEEEAEEEVEVELPTKEEEEEEEEETLQDDLSDQESEEEEQQREEEEYQPEESEADDAEDDDDGLSDSSEGSQPVEMADITAQQWRDAQDEMEALKTRFTTLMDLQKKKGGSSSVKLDKFAGFKDDRSAVVWWSKLEAVAIQNNWDEEETVAAASEAMKNDAEEWNYNRLFAVRNKIVNKKETLVGFREAFFLQFDQAQSVASMTESIANLKQKSSENCSVFFVRVDAAFNRVAQDYFVSKNWLNPVLPDEAVPDDLGNDTFRKISAVNDFKNECLVETHFVNGLPDNIRKVVMPKVADYRRAGENLLVKVKEVEATLSRAGAGATPQAVFSSATIASVEESIADMDVDVQFNVLAALRGRDRGRGGRGRGSDRGGGGFRGSSDRGYRGGSDRGRGGRGSYNRSPFATPADIRNRTRPKFCTTCKQWAKHADHECRLTQARIAALTPMSQQFDKPEKRDLHDIFYDGEEASSSAGASASGN